MHGRRALEQWVGIATDEKYHVASVKLLGDKLWRRSAKDTQTWNSGKGDRRKSTLSDSRLVTGVSDCVNYEPLATHIPGGVKGTLSGRTET